MPLDQTGCKPQHVACSPFVFLLSHLVESLSNHFEFHSTRPHLEFFSRLVRGGLAQSDGRQWKQGSGRNQIKGEGTAVEQHELHTASQFPLCTALFQGSPMPTVSIGPKLDPYFVSAPVAVVVPERDKGMGVQVTRASGRWSFFLARKGDPRSLRVRFHPITTGPLHQSAD